MSRNRLETTMQIVQLLQFIDLQNQMMQSKVFSANRCNFVECLDFELLYNKLKKNAFENIIKNRFRKHTIDFFKFMLFQFFNTLKLNTCLKIKKIYEQLLKMS